MSTINLFATVLIACAAMSCGANDGSETKTAVVGSPTATPAPSSPPNSDAGAALPDVGLRDALVVCEGCSPELLAAKTQGISDGMEMLLQYTKGTDIRPEHGLVTFHLSGDAVCGAYTAGQTGFYSTDGPGHAHICLFDLDKQNRALPFNPANAVTSADQLLPIHEAMHAWFSMRISNYEIEEPFCKFISFEVSGGMKQFGNGDSCSWFRGTTPTDPDRLMPQLCHLGLTRDDVSEILSKTAAKADGLNRLMTTGELADIVTEVLGKDAVPAFRAVGLLP